MALGLPLIIPITDFFMDISMSIGTSNRFFGKAIRRIYPRINLFMEKFKEAVPSSQTCSAILVAITDDKSADFFQEMPNVDGYFQVMFGCPYPSDDSDLANEVLDRLQKAIAICPMSPAEREMAIRFIQRWESKEIN